MDHFAGLDVSVKETSVCIVDDTGRIVREVKLASEPEALLTALKNPSYHFKLIGLEAGPLSQWLFSALAEAGMPVICVETRHMQAVLKAQINKTDPILADIVRPCIHPLNILGSQSWLGHKFNGFSTGRGEVPRISPFACGTLDNDHHDCRTSDTNCSRTLRKAESHDSSTKS